MSRLLGPYAPQLYAILRIVTGFLFLVHGSQKLFGVPGTAPPVQLASQFGVAGLIEFFGGLLIMIGLFTGTAAFLASGLMAFAYFLAHFQAGYWPSLNGGEPAALFSFIFVYLAAAGSGIWSVDALRRPR